MQKSEEKKLRAGLFVGVSEYSDPKIGSLDFADNDAQAILESLSVSSEFSESASTICTSVKKSTFGQTSQKSTILTELHKFSIGPKLDTFVFFFSGHGFRSNSGLDYLIPKDATTADLEETSIPFSKIVSRCCEVKARQIILIIDACRAFSPGGKTFQRIEPGIPAEFFSDKHLAVFFSADAGTKSYESNRESLGLFTASLCDSLDIEHDCMTLEEISDFVNDTVSQKSLDFVGERQTPVAFFLNEQSRQFVLPRSKLIEKLRLPSFVRSETGRKRLDYEGELHVPLVIDYGTTKSVLAYNIGSGITYGKDQNGRICIPSTVKFRSDGRYEIGLDPSFSVSSKYSKRDLLSDRDSFLVQEEKLLPEHYSMLIIQSLKRNFEEETQLKAKRCILSVPTDYNALDISRILSSARGAGLLVERVVPEPTAAALNVLSDLREMASQPGSDFINQRVLVVDMGGGTLDVALVLVTLTKDVEMLDEEDDTTDDAPPYVDLNLRVLSSSGDARLGGIDFNPLLRGLVLDKISKFKFDNGATIQDFDKTALDGEVERGKITLSNEDHCLIALEQVVSSQGKSPPVSIRVERSELEMISSDLFGRFKKCIDVCIEHGALWDEGEDIADRLTSQGSPNSAFSAQTYALDIDAVILAGQSGRVHGFVAHLRNRFPNAKLFDEFCDIAVARGLSEWVYGDNFDLTINDIAYTYISVRGFSKVGNQLVFTGGEAIANIVYPTDPIPVSVVNTLNLKENSKRVVTITTNTIGKTPEDICTIEIPDDQLSSQEILMKLSVDEYLTIVVEFRDFSDNEAAWQLNNLFRVPTGFYSYSDITPDEKLPRRLKRLGS